MPIDDVRVGPTPTHTVSRPRFSALRWWMVPPDHLRNRSGFQWRAASGADSAAFAAVLTSSSGSLRPRQQIRHCPVAADQRETIRDPPL